MCESHAECVRLKSSETVQIAGLIMTGSQGLRAEFIGRVTKHFLFFDREACSQAKAQLILTSCCSGLQQGSALPGLPSQVWPYRKVNPTVQDTVETSSDKMENGSEVDQGDQCINLLQSYQISSRNKFLLVSKWIEKRMTGINKDRRD